MKKRVLKAYFSGCKIFIASNKTSNIVVKHQSLYTLIFLLMNALEIAITT